MAKKRERARATAAHEAQHDGRAEQERRRGQQAFARGDYDAALHAWAAALRLEGGDAGLRRALAEAHFRRACLSGMRAPDHALDDLRRACEYAPADAVYRYHLALHQHRLGDVNEARHGYQDCLDRDPDDALARRAAYLLCLAHAEAGYDPSRHAAWAALTPEQQERIQPRDPAIVQAVTLLEKGEFERAEPFLSQVLSAQRGFCHYYLGVAAWKRGAVEEALARWLSARAGGFNTPALRQNLGAAYTLRAGQITDSAALADTVRAGLKVVPGSLILTRQRARAEWLEALRAAHGARWSEALKHWRAARTALEGINAPVPRELLANLAVASERLERWTDAAALWRELVRRRPRRGEQSWPPQRIASLWAHIDTLYTRAGRFEQAAATLRYAIRARPDDLTLRLALVRRHIENENWRAAATAVLGALERAPGHPDATALYAQIADQQGDLDTAIDAWERVLAAAQKALHPTAHQRLIRLYAARADFYLTIEDFALAAADLARAVALCPDDASLKARHGAALAHIDPARARAVFASLDGRDAQSAALVIAAWHAVGAADEAARWFERAAAGGILSGVALVDLAHMVWPATPDAGEMYLRRAVQAVEGAEPEQAVPVLTRAAALYAVYGDRQRAEQHARRALTLDAGYGPAHLHLGLWDVARGRRQAGQDHLQRALAWAKQARRDDIAEGIEEALNLVAERYKPTLDDVLDAIDPDGQDADTRRLMGGTVHPGEET